jgi:hypothetical protein
MCDVPEAKHKVVENYGRTMLLPVAGKVLWVREA